jgi:hypothetical protein
VTMEKPVKQPNEYVGAGAGGGARCALTDRAASASPAQAKLTARSAAKPRD